VGDWKMIRATPRDAFMPSSSIRKIEYDRDKQVLSVWFVASGKRYDYEGVSEQTHAEFRSAFSKGRFFIARIRDRYRYRLISED
jgi:hypothetical protein